MDYSISISVIMATYNTEISVLKEAVDAGLIYRNKRRKYVCSGKSG